MLRLPFLFQGLATLWMGQYPAQVEASADDRDAIRRVIMAYYHQAHVDYAPALYERILHPEWKLFFVDDAGHLHVIERHEYLRSYAPENRKPHIRWRTQIDSIDVDGDLASVKLRIGNQEYGYVDFFNMIRSEGRWWIVHKISRRAAGAA